MLLLWSIGFSEGIGDVGVPDPEARNSRESDLETEVDLLGSRRVRVTRDYNVTTTCGAVANPANFLAVVFVLLDRLYPDPVENCGIMWCRDGAAKQILFLVIIQLDPFSCLPLCPLILKAKVPSIVLGTRYCLINTMLNGIDNMTIHHVHLVEIQLWETHGVEGVLSFVAGELEPRRGHVL
jgi:hypothetical protein